MIQAAVTVAVRKYVFTLSTRQDTKNLSLSSDHIVPETSNADEAAVLGAGLSRQFKTGDIRFLCSLLLLNYRAPVLPPKFFVSSPCPTRTSVLTRSLWV